MGTRVQTPVEIERLLEGTDVALLLDSGHLTAAGGDALQAARDWRDRIAHVHVKDVRLAVLEAAPTGTTPGAEGPSANWARETST